MIFLEMNLFSTQNLISLHINPADWSFGKFVGILNVNNRVLILHDCA